LGLEAVEPTQADTAALLLTWLTGGVARISRDDIHMARVLGMTLLPQLAGIVLMLAFGIGLCRLEPTDNI
jgi:ABC-type arginine/histidine transport system permease subunit